MSTTRKRNDAEGIETARKWVKRCSMIKDLSLNEIPLNRSDLGLFEGDLKKDEIIYLLTDLASFLGYCGDRESRLQIRAIEIALELVKKHMKE